MKKILQNKKILITCITLILVFSILGISVGLRKKKNTPLLIQSFGNDVVAIGSRVVDVPVRFISRGLNSVNSILNTQKENDYLKQNVTNLKQTQARDEALRAENKQLKSALKLKNSLTDYTLVNATVISRSPDNWSDLLVVNKGNTSGIKKNMAVMCGGGVIGRIIEVNATSSKVELITTTDKSANRFSVQAKNTNNQETHGLITAVGSNQLVFSQTVNNTKLKPGTKVYTSGLGGNSPKGLLIGTIGLPAHDSFGLSHVFEINPTGELNDPSVVTVVKRKVDE